jgi:anti-sigma factor RsiW
MMQEIDAPGCGRENDLVAFLYGELDDVEQKSFKSHMHACQSCQAQTGEFRSIRESVAAWRDESLGRAQVTAAPQLEPLNQRKPSGLAALRAFFDLSPLWMKGAVGLAAILFCIFTVLAVAQLRPTPGPVAAINAHSQGYSQQELNALVEERVREELVRRNTAEQPSVGSPAVALKPKTVGPRSRSLSSHDDEVASAVQNGRARRPLSKTERDQLAADLRLTSSGTERGVDLVDDQINQP